ncbi:phosphoesterase [Aeromonas phage BUCT695]|uniref:phosphoesterase n=1 Tax=Aeromonas phage BUCT695 TaxID=2908630 RepID=UPI0023299BC7|nr:phosphoesterase [Aeromonas phage BUCT695]UIW10558.1 putative serine/threonine phosphatase [Aeromonas phage BUCT695]
MAQTFFIADGHFGHRNILNFRKQFKTIKEHDDYIIDNINSVATKRDKIFFLGDWVFNPQALSLIARIKCPHKHLVMGNHDDYNADLLSVFNTISGPIKYKEFWLTHIPVHPMELRGKYNIHGHMHDAVVKDPNYISVCCEQIGYTPISLDEIRSKIHERKTKPKIIRKAKHGKTGVKKARSSRI